MICISNKNITLSSYFNPLDTRAGQFFVLSRVSRVGGKTNEIKPLRLGSKESDYKLMGEQKVKVIFLFEIQIIFYRSWDKKIFGTASRLFRPEARFKGFFGLREAVRPLEGQKIPRNGPKAKRVWTKCKTCFCP